MTDKELVDWLRNCSIYEGRAFLRQSADRIEALEAENERLREALREVVDCGDLAAIQIARATIAGHAALAGDSHD